MNIRERLKPNVSFAFLLLGLLVGQSCADDSKPDLLTLSTINKVATTEGGQKYYFTQDDGQTMHPGKGEEWLTDSGYDDGQRAFVLFNTLDVPADGYDYNIEVKQITPVLTQKVITLGEDGNTEETVGDDKINATYLWISKDRKYLTVEFQYYSTGNEEKKHLLNLAINPSAAKDKTDAGEGSFIELEFRHNSQGDSPSTLSEGYVSFKLDPLRGQMEGRKGIRVRVNTLYEGVKQYDVNFSD
ncbi:MAG: NigD-like protein [Mediterranea sp.]|jgi:hypothetical protein|nr:NigD-like protein [Mediterranea sp.]